MTNTLPVAYYLKDVDGDPPRRGARMASHFGNASEIEARVADAHARGILEGQAAAQVENDAALGRQIAASDQKLRAERQRWVEEQGERLADLVASSMEDVRRRIADQVAECLKPVVSEAVRMRAVSQLSDVLDDVLSKGDYTTISISGPEDLLDQMKARISDRHSGVTFVASDGPNLSVSADETILEARIGAWASAIYGEEA